jgi:transposase
MKIIPAATTVELTPEERQVLEALAGSRKAEARMRDRTRIVLLASAGMASRAIAREVRCTPGTVSKWRVRYANERIAGLSETGDRGNEPKYGPEHGQRILALLDKPPPAGYSNWTAPLLARELVDIHEQHIWRFLRAQKIGACRRLYRVGIGAGSCVIAAGWVISAIGEPLSLRSVAPSIIRQCTWPRCRGPFVCAWCIVT